MKNTNSIPGLCIAFLLFCLTLNVACSAQTITSVAGNGTIGGASIGDGGPATGAVLGDIEGMTFDRHGNLYVVQNIFSRVRKITPAGIISTIAGYGPWSGASTGGFSGDGGPATAALLATPHGVAVDVVGNVYISDAYNNRIRVVDTFGIIRTIAGNGSTGYSGDGGAATAASLFNPMGISLDASGNLFVADLFNNCIRKITPAGIITTVAGTGTGGFGGDGGQATAAKLWFPYDVHIDGGNNIYIADYSNRCVRKINTSGIISTIAGDTTTGFSGDGGPATAARLASPWAVKTDGYGNIYIADDDNQRVRMINTSGIITTIAGNGTGGFSGDCGPATAAELFFPHYVAISGVGNIYISDGANGRVRMIDNAGGGIIHGPDTICVGHSATMTDSVAGGTWRVTNTAVATISAGGSITGLASGRDTVLYIVTNICTTDTARRAIFVNSPCVTGVGNVTRLSGTLTVSPNPVKDGSFVVFVASAFNESSQLFITDVLGKRVAQQTIVSNKETAIQLSVPAGIYFISVTSASGSRICERIVVE